MKLNHTPWIAMAGMALLLAGCNREDAGSLARDVGQITHDATKAADNVQLSARVYSVLGQRKGIDLKGLHIDTAHGVVTVGGHVRDAHEKHLVLQTVRDTRGVDKVVDNLHIAP
jgi:osmotically-inducible protein OsmY